MRRSSTLGTRSTTVSPPFRTPFCLTVHSHPLPEPVVDVADFDDHNLDVSHLESLEDDSPYPEVRSAVANTDDPDMPVNTFRAWFIGIIWSIIIPGLNQFFFFRYPSVSVTSVVAQLISFPLLRLWARLVPNVKIFGVSLNPGPFTIKEHVIITIMANVGSGSAYAVSLTSAGRRKNIRKLTCDLCWTD